MHRRLVLNLEIRRGERIGLLGPNGGGKTTLHPERTLLEAVREVAALSGGERSRLMLARLALQGPNLLVLDEPTNHLGLPARQLLEEVLAACNRLATRLWVIADGALTIHEGNYTTCRLARRYRPAAATATAIDAATTAQQPGHAPVGEHGRPLRERRTRTRRSRSRVSPYPPGSAAARGASPHETSHEAAHSQQEGQSCGQHEPEGEEM